jgi:toxin ParE1/3/4
MILLSSDAVSDVNRLRSFLRARNPDAAVRALAKIWAALERVERFPELGRPTEDADIRQIVVAFGAAGYIVRYRRLVDTDDLFVTRIWHGREKRQ